MCSGSEAGSYLRLMDLVYHSTLDLRVIQEKKESLSVMFLVSVKKVVSTAVGEYGHIR